MSLKKLLLTTAIASTTLSGFANNENSNYNLNNEEDSIDMVQQEPILQIPTLTKEKLYICLNTDENSYTHTEVLKNIPEDGHEIVLEYPVEQLFKTYNKRPHPLAVGGVAKTYGALMGKNNLSERLNRYPQHLSQSVNAITSQTKYATTDTLRFGLIESDLAESFPFKLSDQLKEDGFEKYSDKDSLLISKKNKPHYALPDDLYKLLSKYNTDKDDTNKEYIYDIVVKKLTDGQSALAVYRDGKLFMSSYVSVGLPYRRTKTGQFSILSKKPYYHSIKYDSPMPLALEFDQGGFYLHQGNVTGSPASHGCVRLPGVYADILYSLIRNENDVDVFIDKNLYKQ